MSNSLVHMSRHSPHSTSKIDHETIKVEKYQSKVTSSSSTPLDDSPLDFSTKKPKIERIGKNESGESPCSRLRNILNMKFPLISQDSNSSVLNLSQKEASPETWATKSNGDSRSSSSSSPILNHQMFIPSPRPASIPTQLPPGSIPGLNLSPYFSQNLSPLLSQPIPSVNFDISPSNFPHISNMENPALPFGTSIPHTPTSNSNNISKRVPRPFKAYPKDPMSFPSGMYGLPLGATPGSIEALIQSESNQNYAEFRKRMLAQTHASKTRRGGQRNNSLHQNNSHNILQHSRQGLNMGETAGQDEPLNFEIMDHGGISSADESHSASEDGRKLHGKSEQQLKDEAYWERRRKNNEAAKRSRDARRAKEDEIAIRAAFLEQENLKLRFELCALKSETEKLRCILYSN